MSANAYLQVFAMRSKNHPLQPAYSDILDRIADPPRGWFNRGRYNAFSQNDLSIGPPDVALTFVYCRVCGTEAREMMADVPEDRREDPCIRSNSRLRRSGGN